ncbi:ATP-binding protein [Brevundimonas sp. FT23028]|uniref:ATP-binding protein n=1 Tax=Brevundimonas sp. FT23028 TaxID=3393748 RepID=UPI003B589345
MEGRLLQWGARYNLRNCLVFLAVIIVIHQIQGGGLTSGVGWLVMIGLIANLCRMVFTPALARRAKDGGVREARDLNLALTFGSLLNGVVFALIAAIILPGSDVTSQFVTVVVAAALAGGAVGVLSPLRWVAIVYVTLILLPAAALIWREDILPPVISGLGVVFWLAMCAGIFTNSHLYRAYIEGEEEVARMLAMQREQTEAIAALNASLETRVAERTAELRLMVQEAQSANRAKSQFLASMSHELRTPLNGVFGMMQMMERGDLAADQRARLALAKDSASTLLAIINDVLDISKVEAGRLHLEVEAFDADVLFDVLAQNYELQARSAGLVFRAEIGETVGYRSGDPVRVKQVVGNLLANAIKFTPAGSVSLTVEGDDEGLTVTVQDTGRGIPAAALDTVFERFEQCEGTDARRGGTGLGLSICRELAELMGGAIRVESEVGKGACFEVRLPLPRLEGGTAGTGAGDETLSADQALVVDDNAVNRTVLAGLLQSLGFEVQIACDGAEAVRAVEGGDFGVILMDINMPIMDGLEATRIIRAREKRRGLRPTPILAVTASVLSHETEQYFTAGMDGVIAKPIELTRLVASLQQLGQAEAA